MKDFRGSFRSPRCETGLGTFGVIRPQSFIAEIVACRGVRSRPGGVAVDHACPRVGERARTEDERPSRPNSKRGIGSQIQPFGESRRVDGRADQGIDPRSHGRGSRVARLGRTAPVSFHGEARHQPDSHRDSTARITRGRIDDQHARNPLDRGGDRPVVGANPRRPESTPAFRGG